MHHLKRFGSATISNQIFTQQPNVVGAIFNHQDAHGASPLPAVARFFGNNTIPNQKSPIDLTTVMNCSQSSHARAAHAKRLVRADPTPSPSQILFCVLPDGLLFTGSLFFVAG
jgi:hypothetical protein